MGYIELMDYLQIMREVPKIDIHEHFAQPYEIETSSNTLSKLGSMAYLGFYDFYPGLKFPRFPREDIEIPEEDTEFYNYLHNTPITEPKQCLIEGFNSLYALHTRSQLENYHNLIKTLGQEIRRKYQSREIYQEFIQKYNIQKILCDIPHSEMGLNIATTIQPLFPNETVIEPFLRINSLLFAFDPHCWTNHTNLLNYFCSNIIHSQRPESFDDFLSIFDKIIAWAPKNCIGFKCASAYERTLDFGHLNFSMDNAYPIAKKCYGTAISELEEKDWLTFGNYIVHYLFSHYFDHHLPFQIHTGMAIPTGSNPNLLRPLLMRFPEVPVELLHAGYPNTNEAIQLVAEFDHVYSDFVWIPHLNQQEIQKMVAYIHQKSCWDRIMAYGGDCACIEGSTGALEVLMRNLNLGFNSLENTGTITKKDIQEIIEKIF